MANINSVRTRVENQAAGVDRSDETIKTMIAEFFRLVFSFIIGMLLASFFDFSDIQIKPDSQDVKFSEYSEIVDMQKQARELMQNYDTLLNQAK